MKKKVSQSWWKTDTVRLGLFVVVVVAVSGLLISKAWVVPEMPPLTVGERRNPQTNQQSLFIGKSTIQVEVRRTETEQELGLSWRPSLEAEAGMAFVYPSPRKVMYWMKGMQFPLDFIWIAHEKVIQITENVPCPTMVNQVPKTVVPASEVDMVVEVNAGWTMTHGVMVGDEVRWRK